MNFTLTTRLLLILLLVLPGLALAQDEIDCSEQSLVVKSLNQDLRAAETVLGHLRSVIEDYAAAEATPDQLEELLTSQSGEQNSQSWPEQLTCPDFADEYAASLADLQRTQGHISNIRDRLWRKQRPEIRDAVLGVWRSRQRVSLHQQEILVTADAPYDPEVRAFLIQLSSSLEQQRKTFFQLLPGLVDGVTAKDTELWIDLWRQSQTLAISTMRLRKQAELPQNQSAETLQLLKDHLRILELDALVMTNNSNIVRSLLWREKGDMFEQALTRLKLDHMQLLGSELRSLRNVFKWLYVDALVGFKPAGGVDSSFWRYFQVGEYLFGMLCFWGLAIVARWLRTPVSNFHTELAKRYRKQRLYHQVLRGTTSFPTLLPWFVGWIGLDLLGKLFLDYHLVLLLPLIPFAKIYILYGLVAEFCSWMLHRINERASVFLSEAQSSRIARHSRYASGVILLPWLLQAMANLAIGGALLVHHLRWLTLVSILVALSLLLHRYRKEFVAALQSYLPPQIDPWVERLFLHRAAFIVRPLGIPVLLCGQIIDFCHRGLIDFDWYRRISARSFALRSQTSQEASLEDGEDLEEYRKWFDAGFDEKKPPYISVELLSRLQESLSQWQEHASEENSLLIQGARGSGKSTLMERLGNWAEDEQGLKVCRVQVPAKTISAESVTDLLGEALGVNLSAGPSALVASEADREPTVVIIEDAQNLFLRKVGGLGGWEMLLSLLRTRVQSIYWVLAISNHSWSYLRQVFGGDYQFSKVIRTKAWTQSEIRSLILSRHQLSGLSLDYDDILLSTRGPQAGNVRNAEQLYFNLLWDVSGGNPMQALEIWLKSISVRGKSVLVSLPQPPSMSMLDNLSGDTLFVYSALMLHENMTSDELVETTSIQESTIRAALKTAFDAGFVWRTADRRYRVVPLWIPILGKLLNRKNLLNE